MLNKVSVLYELLVIGKQKAVVAGVVGVVVVYAAKHGIDIETLTVKEAVEIVVSGVIVAVSVFLKKNQ